MTVAIDGFIEVLFHIGVLIHGNLQYQERRVPSDDFPILGARRPAMSLYSQPPRMHSIAVEVIRQP